MFFRGYVETKDKQCVEKFKGRTDFKTYEQVKSLPEFAGILAEDTILVDLDDGESSDVLFKVVQDYSLNCRVYRTTRGKHFALNRIEQQEKAAHLAYKIHQNEQAVQQELSIDELFAKVVNLCERG